MRTNSNEFEAIRNPGTPRPLPPGPFEKALSLNRELLKPKEVAELMARSESFIYALIDEGKLEAFAPTGRKVKRKVITRRSVLLVMAESGRNPEILAPQVESLLAWLSPQELDLTIREATRLLENPGRPRGISGVHRKKPDQRMELAVEKESFAPIAAEFEKLFKGKGWMP